jgi:branched-subunit amino acid transport protein
LNAGLSGIEMAIVVVGLALSTFITRTSFLLAGSKLRLNHRIETALRYAPVCTLSAIIVPNVLIHAGGALDLSLLNPRLIGVAAAAIWLCFSRNILGCLASGMLAYSLARLYL